jgi:two-component system response regulator HydG
MNDAPPVLVIDDKPNMIGLVAKVLGRSAHVVPASSVKSGIAALDSTRVRAVVCDLRLPDGEGLAVLRALRTRGSAAPFILMTAYGTVGTAVQAMREGAYDYVTKPFDPDDLLAIVERALAQSAILSVSDASNRQPDVFSGMLGRSPAMKEVFRLIDRVAVTDATVLVLGETGTGKELVARAIHERSSRAQRALVAVNCAAIARSLIESELFGYARGAFTGATTDRAGIFEAADKSTLFLDELGELRGALQAKLTRVLESRAIRRIGETRERPVDVRLVAATHRDLPAMVKARTFREDLWFRLNVCAIELPPLRDRVGDIPLLATQFLAERAPLVRSPALRFSDDVMAAVVAHAWPGNVRELRSVVERMLIHTSGPEITVDALPAHLRGRSSVRPPSVPPDEVFAELSLREALAASRETVSRRYADAVMRRFEGDVSAAAQHAGIERESFYRLLRRHGIDPAAYRSSG